MESLLKQKFEESLQFAISEGWGSGIEKEIEIFKEISTTNARVIKTNTGYGMEWSATKNGDTFILIGNYNEEDEIYDAKIVTD